MECGSVAEGLWRDIGVQYVHCPCTVAVVMTGVLFVPGWLHSLTIFEVRGSNFLGIGADYACNASVQVDASQPAGLLITNGEFTAFHDKSFAPKSTAGTDDIIFHTSTLFRDNCCVRLQCFEFVGADNCAGVLPQWMPACCCSLISRCRPAPIPRPSPPPLAPDGRVCERGHELIEYRERSSRPDCCLGSQHRTCSDLQQRILGTNDYCIVLPKPTRFILLLSALGCPCIYGYGCYLPVSLITRTNMVYPCTKSEGSHPCRGGSFAANI